MFDNMFHGVTRWGSMYGGVTRWGHGHCVSWIRGVTRWDSMQREGKKVVHHILWSNEKW